MIITMGDLDLIKMSGGIFYNQVISSRISVCATYENYRLYKTTINKYSLRYVIEYLDEILIFNLIEIPYINLEHRHIIETNNMIEFIGQYGNDIREVYNFKNLL